MECTSCQALAGEIVLTNGPRLDLDDWWRVEHCHPVAVAGWLVLILRRHARALHELTDDEAESLGRWLPRLCRALHDATGAEVEYVMQFAEGDGFHHVHFHLVARTPDGDAARGRSVTSAGTEGVNWCGFAAESAVEPRQKRARSTRHARLRRAIHASSAGHRRAHSAVTIS